MVERAPLQITTEPEIIVHRPVHVWAAVVKSCFPDRPERRPTCRDCGFKRGGTQEKSTPTSVSWFLGKAQEIKSRTGQLGHGFILAQSNLYCRQFKKGEIVRGVFLISCSDAPKVFDPVEEPLDTVALTIEGRAEADLPSSIYFRRNIGRGARFLAASLQPVRVIGLVCQKNSVISQAVEKTSSGGTVGGLAWCQDHLQPPPGGGCTR